VVDQSLLRQAADRGVTICFADLDGADGLWVPEERTVLVNRGLSEAKVAEVIEHELAHVVIDDQHADLDAGKDVLVGQPPSPLRRRETVALAAALSLVAVVGGVMYGIHSARGPAKLDRVAPNPGPGLSVGETAYPKPSTTVTRTTLPGGRVVERTIVITATPPLPTGTGSPIAFPTGTATKAVPRPTAPRTTAGGAPAGQTSAAPSAPPPTTEPPAPTPPADPTTVAPTTPAAETGGVGDTGDQGVGGTDSAPAVTEPAAVADGSIPSGDGTTGP
jgi:Putative metallopeptidase family (DUF6782)